MKLRRYNKPALSYSEQVEQLRFRGLKISNRERSKHLLENLSYYRLSGYWYPLLEDKPNHIFKKDAQFQRAFDLYLFDRELRALVARELEKVEVSVRAVMIYVLSHDHDPKWYKDQSLFSNTRQHKISLKAIDREYKRSDADFIKSFDQKYKPPLPSWMAMEICSFGTLSKLYENLNPGGSKRTVANYYGVADAVFESWLHTLVYIRNICAHHSRLWNKIMSITPAKPRKILKSTANGRIKNPVWLSNHPVSNNKTYYSLSIIKFLLQTIHPTNRFSIKLRLLFEAYPNVDPRAMGFPRNWENESLWKTSGMENLTIKVLSFLHKQFRIRL
jgi:abortive infection bacteriophage resistance protein